MMKIYKGKDFCVNECCIILGVASTALEIIIVCQDYKKDLWSDNCLCQ